MLGGKDFVCPRCKNQTHFLELNISGYVANFEVKPATVVTGVSAYENVGIFCGVCFDEGSIIRVGDENDLLPAALIERKLVEQGNKRLKLIT